MYNVHIQSPMLGYSKREIKSTSFDNALMENPPLKYVYLSRTYRSSYITCMYICTNVHTMSSVPDPWCFVKDPDPRISTTGLRIRIRILIFLRSGSHDTKKKKFLFLINYGRYTLISVFKDNKSQTVEIRVFLNFFLWWKDPDPAGPKTYEPYGSGSGTLL